MKIIFSVENMILAGLRIRPLVGLRIHVQHTRTCQSCRFLKVDNRYEKLGCGSNPKTLLLNAFFNLLNAIQKQTNVAFDIFVSSYLNILFVFFWWRDT
jgi:hypothetical protein